MATNITPSVLPSPTIARRWNRRRGLAIVGGIVVLIVVMYILAWWSVYRLSVTFLQDADASYEAERYLDALVGFEEFDQSSGQYIDRGGYAQVQRIWSDPYSLPIPAEIRHAMERIDEIINQRLTIEDAEQFVQENIGRSNPYMGLIYLRLGELYEAEGSLRDAKDIYESFAELFSNDPALIERARSNLAELENQSVNP